MDFDDDVARMVVAWWVRSGGLKRLAYPAPHRGSHKGVPLRCGFGVLRRVSPVHGGNARRTKGATPAAALGGGGGVHPHPDLPPSRRKGCIFAPLLDDHAPVGARPRGCPGAGWGTPSAPARRDARDGFRRRDAHVSGVVGDVWRIDALAARAPLSFGHFPHAWGKP